MHNYAITVMSGILHSATSMADSSIRRTNECIGIQNLAYLKIIRQHCYDSLLIFSKTLSLSSFSKYISFYSKNDYNFAATKYDKIYWNLTCIRDNWHNIFPTFFRRNFIDISISRNCIYNFIASAEHFFFFYARVLHLQNL